MLSVYHFMLYIIYVTLIMSLWDLYYFVAIFAEFYMDSLLLLPPQLRRSFKAYDQLASLDPVGWSQYMKFRVVYVLFTT
jgi:hypothetical protein